MQRWAYGIPDTQRLSLTQIGIAGFISAIPTTAIMTPGERIKVCVSGMPSYTYFHFLNAA